MSRNPFVVTTHTSAPCHAAFDKRFVGVRPNGIIKVRRDIRKGKDGPMLLHGLKRRTDSGSTMQSVLFLVSMLRPFVPPGPPSPSPPVRNRATIGLTTIALCP